MYTPDEKRAYNIGYSSYFERKPNVPGIDERIRRLVSDLPVGSGASRIFAAFTAGFNAAVPEYKLGK